MPNIIKELMIDRVDLVDEGANSAAFIELFKRKEQKEPMSISEIIAKMKAEHGEVVQAELDAKDAELAKAKEDIDAKEAEVVKAKEDLDAKEAELAKAKEDIDAKDAEISKANEIIALYKSGESCTCDGEADENGICKECQKPKKKEATKSFDEEEVIKSMPTEAQEMFRKMRDQKTAAEETLRKAREAEAHAEAVAKAATLKSLPIEMDKLVSLVKNADSELFDCLTTISAALDGTVLDEVGKAKGAVAADDAWGKIEAEAENVAKRDNVSKQKAISIVIKEKPELYKEYLKEV